MVVMKKVSFLLLSALLVAAVEGKIHSPAKPPKEFGDAVVKPAEEAVSGERKLGGLRECQGDCDYDHVRQIRSYSALMLFFLLECSILF